jgi:hypothetical protein
VKDENKNPGWQPAGVKVIRINHAAGAAGTASLAEKPATLTQ